MGDVGFSSVQRFRCSDFKWPFWDLSKRVLGKNKEVICPVDGW